MKEFKLVVVLMSKCVVTSTPGVFGSNQVRTALRAR